MSTNIVMCTDRCHVVGAAYRVDDARPDARADALAARPQHSNTCATFTAKRFHAFCVCTNTRLGQKPKCATPPLPQIVCQQLLQQVPRIRSGPMPKTSAGGAAESLAKIVKQLRHCGCALNQYIALLVFSVLENGSVFEPKSTHKTVTRKWYSF